MRLRVWLEYSGECHAICSNIFNYYEPPQMWVTLYVVFVTIAELQTSFVLVYKFKLKRPPLILKAVCNCMYIITITMQT